nr:hypothetical protein [uncultured Carboxylicivirga sp.]
MKTTKTAIVFAIIALLSFSCENSIDDINVTIEETGSIVYVITDPEGEPVKSAKLNLFNAQLLSNGISFSPSDDYAIKTVYTDEDGQADFGKINSGLYLVYSKLTTKDNEEYTVFNFVQVVVGEVETRNVDLSTYVGSLDLKVYLIDDNDKYVADNMNIALIAANNYDSFLSFEEYMNNSIPIGKTDSEGSITANKIPHGNYYLIGYYNSTEYDILSIVTYYSESYIYITKDETYEDVLYAENENFDVSNSNPTDYQFQIFYTEDNAISGVKDTTYLTNANLLFSTTSSSNFSSAYSYREFIVSSDSNGLVSVSRSQLEDYNYYYLWVYLDMATYQQLGGFYFPDELSETTKLEVDKDTFFKVYGSFEMIGKAKYEIGSSIDTLSLSNVNITLTTSTSPYFSGITELYTTKTDSLGHALIENVPVGEYYLWAYTNEDHSQRAYFKVKIEEGQTTFVEPVFDADEVLIIYNDMTFEIYSGSSSSSAPVKNAYIILTEYHKINVASALTSALAVGKTDENGIAVIENLEINTSYYVMVYYDYENYYSPYTDYTVSTDPDKVYTILNTEL